MEINENGSLEPSIINKFTSIILCLAMIGAGVLSLFLPFFSWQGISITPLDLLENWDVTGFKLSIGELPLLTISYYVSKYFHYIFAVVLVLCAFSALIAFLVRGPKVHKQTRKTMYILLTFMLLQTLLAFNYINVSYYMDQTKPLSTTMITSFGIGVIVMILKILTDIIFGAKVMPDAVKEVGSTAYNSFTQSFLALLGLVCPVYVLPGFVRVFGFDIILKSPNDFMSFLPMSGVYSTLLLAFTGLTAFFFLVNIILYAISKKAFVSFNHFSHMFSLFTIITYALLGISYLLNYLEAGGFSHMLTVALNTYSYIPLLLLFIYQCGYGFTRIASGKVVVQYKVYATPDELVDEQQQDEALEKGKKGKKGKMQSAKKKGEIGDPIPAFSELDKKAPEFDADYQSKMEHVFEDITLPKLVEHVIEYAKYSRERLSYGPVEVKTFIAGLAASRLSILQGMSGTGKTSLPKIFMEAIDGFCEIVAIESSWRDKNELLGYYNEFNKKYTPKTFTQYLYKASLNKEIPILIVLDEMNLSRIEYYFSDFLSLMEAREHMRYIKLFDVQLFPSIDEREKYTALRDGHTIDIPTNVWFIGTANRDESTFEISDKVYDRAQTMNFDKRASKVVITEEKDIPQRYVPYSTLRKLFDETKEVAFDAEQYEPIKKVEVLLRPYKISFGNRVLKQIETFVNAYVACSEINSPEDQAKFTHEAVDCILFSKVVRKLELKQINDIDTLIEEFEAVNMPKSVEFLQTLRETA